MRPVAHSRASRAAGSPAPAGAGVTALTACTKPRPYSARRTRVGVDVAKRAFLIIAVEQVLHVQAEPNLLVDLIEAEQVDHRVAAHGEACRGSLAGTVGHILATDAQPQSLECAIPTHRR